MGKNEDQEASFGRFGAEFIMVDLELVFAFLGLASTSVVRETKARIQKNTRIAYDAVLRFLPRSLTAFSAPERRDMEIKLAELKSRLEQLGEKRLGKIQT
jgi:hypothetical protein